MNKTKRRSLIGMLMSACVLLAGCNVNINIDDNVRQSGDSTEVKEYIEKDFNDLSPQTHNDFQDRYEIIKSVICGSDDF